MVDGLHRWRIAAPTDGDGLDVAWRALARFASRYTDALAARQAFDGPGLLAAATAALVKTPPPYEHVLVDDFETATVATARLLDALAAEARSLCVAANRHAAIGSRLGASTQFFDRSTL